MGMIVVIIGMLFVLAGANWDLSKDRPNRESNKFLASCYVVGGILAIVAGIGMFIVDFFR